MIKSRCKLFGHFGPFSAIFGHFWFISVKFGQKFVVLTTWGHFRPFRSYLTIDFSRPMVHFFLQVQARKAISCFRFQNSKSIIFSTFYKVLWHHRLLGPLGLNHFRPLLLWDASLYYDRKNLKCLPESLRHTKSTICILQKVYIYGSSCPDHLYNSLWSVTNLNLRIPRSH